MVLADHPLVSVCMPAYNSEKYIAAAIQSIIDQTYTNWELIIVNDGSVDNTYNVAESYTDKRIKLFQQKNKGQCAAANKAFEMSSGEVVKFFDSDDLLSPEFLEKQVNRLNGSKEHIVSSKWGRFYNDDLSSFTLNPQSVWRDMPADEWLIEAWKKGQPMMQSALWLIPRDILQVSGLWDEELSLINDLDFFTRVLVNCKEVLFEPEAVLYYRSGLSQSLSGTKTRKGIESAYRSIEKATRALLQKCNTKAAQLSCANIWQSFIYDIYPQQADLLARADDHLKKLCPSTLSFPAGGYSKLLVSVIGWKLTRRIQQTKQKLARG
jgi:glycosyltransferase involved in cell wall biosynthesis